MRYETSSNYLQHHGIKGQQWGVRRFQNEDGTLTEEGRRRYLDSFDEREKKADEAIAQAKRQLADIDENGWNAKSAFDPKFVKQIKQEGMLNDENLKFFRSYFERDIKEATTDKKAAAMGRDVINKNANLTYDEMLDEFEAIDKKTATKGEDKKLRDDAENIGKELGLENKTTDIKLTIPDYSKKDLDTIRKSMPKDELIKNNETMRKWFSEHKMLAGIKEYLDGKSEAEQFWIMISVLNQLGEL